MQHFWKADPTEPGESPWLFFKVLSLDGAQNFYEPSGINEVGADGIVVNVAFGSAADLDIHLCTPEEWVETIRVESWNVGTGSSRICWCFVEHVPFWNYGQDPIFLF